MYELGSGKIDPEEVKNILICRLGKIGDLLLAFPAIEGVRLFFKNARIDFLIEEKFHEVIVNNPHIGNIYCLHGLFYNKFSCSDLRTVPLLFKKYDLIVDLQSENISALFLKALSPKYLIGINRNLLSFLNTEGFRTNELMGCDIAYQMVLKHSFPEAELVDNHVFYLSDRDEEFSERFIKKHSLSKKYLIGLNITASSPCKMWNLSKWLELNERLLGLSSDIFILIFNGLNEYNFEIKERERNLTIQNYSIPQAASLMKRCSVFISNETGPMHIAAYLGVETIGLFGPGNPNLWFHYSKKNHYIKKEYVCSKKERNSCERSCKLGECINQISVNDVYGLFEQIYATQN